NLPPYTQGVCEALGEERKKLDDWTIGRLDDWGIGRLGDWGIDRLDDWTIGGLDDWTIDRLDDWTIDRLDDWGGLRLLSLIWVFLIERKRSQRLRRGEEYQRSPKRDLPFEAD
ncbi:MAG TPA: hypothetical protein PKD78_10650, partial [Saprospiraceae bacterium]|nr:hypothetical protein [Saprospiraceae bacterium]